MQPTNVSLRIIARTSQIGEQSHRFLRPHHQEQPPIPIELQLLGAIFAALLGLAFGSFLNVVLTRLPNDESIAHPRSHCRNCTHTLAWWENIPILSWIILRGRCHQCHTPISLRYPLIELAVGLLFTACWIHFAAHSGASLPIAIGQAIGYAILAWLLVALAALDAEHFWLPDLITLPSIAIGFAFTLIQFHLGEARLGLFFVDPQTTLQLALWTALSILAAAGLILVIRLTYWLVRRKEGMGLGDAKLMAMLAAWLGLAGALESFALAILAATIVALCLLAARRSKAWTTTPLPLGTFLCAAALSEIVYPNWLFKLWAATLMPWL